MSPFKERLVGGDAQQLINVAVRLQLHRGIVFPDKSLNTGVSAVACHRDTVMPIADKECLANLVEFDRGQALPCGDPLLNGLPPSLQMLFAREESTGKVLVAAHSARNLVK
jgi:hypothetical protein